MKKILCLLLILVAGCTNQNNRTSVVDHLIDSGFTRNDIGFYEKAEEAYILRVGYNFRNSGFLNTVSNYYSDGPVILQDFSTDVFAYLYTDDIVGFSRICGYKDDTIQLTEALYFPKTKQVVLGDDSCELFDDEKGKSELKSSLELKYEELTSISSKMKLSNKMLQKLIE